MRIGIVCRTPVSTDMTAVLSDDLKNQMTERVPLARWRALGVTLTDALIMASRTPAAFLGLESEMGRIAPGYRADLVAFNQNFEVVGTWVGGHGSMHETSRALH